MQKELPKYLSPRDKNPENNKEYKYIPKKIFQTYKNNKVSPGMYDAVHTWIDKNPDWEYHFYDDNDCRYFIKDNFPKKVLAAYDTLIPGAYKADLWRYCVLYIYGGVYVDIKAELLVSLNDVISDEVKFLSFKDAIHFRSKNDTNIYQAFICAEPNQLFLYNLLGLIVDNSSKGFYGHNQLSITGPGLLGKAINSSLIRDENSPHVPGKHCIEGIKYELWPIPDFKNNIACTFHGEPFFQCEYTDYRKELYSNLSNDLSKNYQLCWFFGKVYTHGKVIRPKNSEYDSREIFSKVRAGYIQKLYKNGNNSLARKQFCIALLKRHFRFRLFRYLIKYELIYPLSRILRLKK